jgi:DNA gyrase/topoisomerase IV subunit B
MSHQAGKVKDASIPGEFIREGLTAVISVKVRGVFAAQTIHTLR